MKRWLLGAGSLFLAFTLVTGCATTDDNNQDEAPMNQNGENGDMMDGENGGTNGGNGNGGTN